MQILLIIISYNIAGYVACTDGVFIIVIFAYLLVVVIVILHVASYSWNREEEQEYGASVLHRPYIANMLGRSYHHN